MGVPSFIRCTFNLHKPVWTQECIWPSMKSPVFQEPFAPLMPHVSAGRAAEDENDAIVKSTKSAALIFLEFMSSKNWSIISFSGAARTMIAPANALFISLSSCNYSGSLGLLLGILPNRYLCLSSKSFWPPTFLFITIIRSLANLWLISVVNHNLWLRYSCQEIWWLSDNSCHSRPAVWQITADERRLPVPDLSTQILKSSSILHGCSSICLPSLPPGIRIQLSTITAFLSQRHQQFQSVVCHFWWNNWSK